METAIIVQQSSKDEDNSRNKNDTKNDAVANTKAAAAVASAESSLTTDNNNVTNSEEEVKRKPLYMSSRLKGYVTLIVASVINYDAAERSDNAVSSNAVASTVTQRRYATAVSLTSLLLCAFCFVVHIDQVTPLRDLLWTKLFAPKSTFELFLLLFLCLWWTVATGTQTSVRGKAGDGRGQYNFYFSTWGCCVLAFWTLERWLVEYGWSSFWSFFSTWPRRAPAWIAILVCSTFSFIWLIDLRLHHGSTVEYTGLQQHYEAIESAQWNWLLIVSALTVCPSLLFVLAELFRESSTTTSSTTSSSAEEADEENSTIWNALEGFCLVLLVLAWIPTVILATTPGGAASLIGNAYFCTWGSTIFVMEAFLWFIHDLRKEAHLAIKQKELEYEEKQRMVLQKSRDLEPKRQKEEDQLEQRQQSTTATIQEGKALETLFDTFVDASALKEEPL